MVRISFPDYCSAANCARLAGNPEVGDVEMGALGSVRQAKGKTPEIRWSHAASIIQNQVAVCRSANL